jgi:hypothetical protein
MLWMHCKAQFQQINQFGRQIGFDVWVIPQYLVFVCLFTNLFIVFNKSCDRLKGQNFLVQKSLLCHPSDLRNMSYTRWRQKGNIVPIHTMRAYKGRRNIAPLTLKLSTRWNWVVNFMPQLLYHQGKHPQYPLNRILGGSQSQSGHFGGQKNLMPHPACSCVTKMSTLSHLLSYTRQVLNI